MSKATKPTKYVKILRGWHEKMETLKKLGNSMEEALTFPPNSKLFPFDLALVQGDINEKINMKDIKKGKYTQSEMNEIIKRIKKLEEIPDIRNKKSKKKKR